MNSIRITTFQLIRKYSKVVNENAGLRRKKDIVKYTKNFDIHFEKLDHEDTGLYESDFREVDELREQKKRARRIDNEQLKQSIVKSKVFQEVEPSFLTYVEKQEIKKLHKSNPEEWTPEKLSESFPALPDTIRKVLKKNWVPKSVDIILKYDKRVIENWKNFKTGNLAVNHRLSQHLMKFRNRIISLNDRKTLLDKFVPPRIELPKPEISFFRSMLGNPVQQNEEVNCAEKNTKKDEKYFITAEKKELAIVKKETYNSMHKKYNTRKEYKNEQKKLVFDEFVKKKLNNPDDTSPEEREVLMSTYKKYVESKNLEDVSVNVLNNEDTNVQEKNINTVEKTSNESSVIIKKERSESKVTKMDTENLSLDTFVKDRNLCMDTNMDYVKCLRIPENIYKKGMTYKVEDCYYDDDGEFLYRVPGLKT